MAVGKFDWPGVSPVAGIRLGTASAGIKYAGRVDLALIEIAEGSSVSGIYTRNAFCAEPITICREHMAQTTSRYLVINSGNANACTGVEGYQAAMSTCEAVANLGNVDKSQVLPFSTGVIGEVLPADRLVAALPEAFTSLSNDGWHAAAQAIMTTDTRAKGISETVEINDKRITISGIAKGAGMIKPNMGTMLGYVALDAAVSQHVLDAMVRIAGNKSFNRITVDGDTSTNDSLILMATGKANSTLISDINSPDGERLLAGISAVCMRLAKEMVRDAEGATKCVEVDVRAGLTAQECLDVAYAVCHSPLIKTAMFASDPNWGRIVAAIGYAGVESLDASGVRVWLDDVLIVESGGRASTYREELGQEVFDRDEFTIRIDLGRGACRETLWTSDLSHEYVKINAEYRT